MYPFSVPEFFVALKKACANFAHAFAVRTARFFLTFGSLALLPERAVVAEKVDQIPLLVIVDAV